MNPGTRVIVLQDAKVVQIETSENIRLRYPGGGANR